MPASAAGTATRRLLLVGNPNVGKSALFTALTGQFAAVSNYPGTTVEIARATLQAGGERYEVIDTPGTTSLQAQSEDEAVTERLLLDGEDATILAVLDARQLKRGLALLASIAELGRPVVVALNMTDEARESGYLYDVDRLGRLLGVPVIETVAVTRHGIGQLRAAIPRAAPLARRGLEARELEQAVSTVQSMLPGGGGSRALATLLVMGDEEAGRRVEASYGASLLEEVRKLVRASEALYAASLASVISGERFRAAQRLVNEVSLRKPGRPGRLAEALGNVAMHRLWGWPVLLGVLYLTYLLVGVVGAGHVVNLLEEGVFGRLVTPGAERLLRAVLPDGAVEAFLVSAPGQAETGGGLLIGEYGLVSMGLSYAVAIVLPIVAFFFVAFALMEDSGYLPRLAVMLNRAFKTIGLNGKAVLPLVLGLGCDTMATMTTRILPSRKERLMVILLLALAVPCSAQLGVILAMLAALSGKALIVWLGALLVSLLVAGTLASRLIPGRASDFLLEVPSIRRPFLRNVLLKTSSRVEWYLREAVPLFLVGTAILWLMDRLHLMHTVERVMAPVVVRVLDLPVEAARAFLVGFLRRDYGAAGLYHMFAPALEGGQVSTGVEKQVVVAMVTITLFMPCVANLLMIVKERGVRAAAAISTIVVVAAIVGGATVRLGLEAMGW